MTRADRKRPVRIDDVTWQLFMRACGARCCACRADTKLEQGHIHRHADGGRLVFENLIPLCKSCNTKYKDSVTPDTRPHEWLDTFWKLMLAENHVGLSWQHGKPLGNTAVSAQPDDSNGFIDLQSAKFTRLNHYITRALDAPLAEPMPADLARTLMWNLFNKSKSCPVPPRPPYNKKPNARQDQMARFATRHGQQDFELAGDAFLREAHWVMDAERGTVQQDSWQHFCDSFDYYLAEGRKFVVRAAELAKRKMEEDRRSAAEDNLRQRQQRWNDYMLASRVQPWPDMTPEDKTIVAELVAEQAAGEVRDVSEERLQQSLVLHRRWKFYTVDELRDARQKRYDKLAQCVEWAKQYGPADQKEFAGQILHLREWIDGLKTVAELNEHGWGVDELHTQLDPSRPRIEFDADERPF
jgi:hypothetical protein